MKAIYIFIFYFQLVFQSNTYAQTLQDPLGRRAAPFTTINCDYGPRYRQNHPANEVTFHPGIDYNIPTFSRAYAVEGGTITNFGAQGEDIAYITVGNWRYMHVYYGTLADNSWEYLPNYNKVATDDLIIQRSGSVITRVLAPNSCVATSYTDPITNQVIVISKTINQGDWIFVAKDGNMGNHLHLDRGYGIYQNPLLWIMHSNTHNPIITPSFKYINGLNALNFTSDIIYGTVILQAKVDEQVDLDLNRLKFQYKNGLITTFQDLKDYNYTASAGVPESLLFRVDPVSSIESDTREGVFPQYSANSVDYFKFRWNTNLLPDGDYTIRMCASDITNNLVNTDVVKKLDNFRPYVTKVLIQSSTLIYENYWKISGSDLVHSGGQSAAYNPLQAYHVYITTNENLVAGSVSLTVKGINSKNEQITFEVTPINGSGKLWSFRIDPEEEVSQLTLLFSGTDANGNKVMDLNESLSSVPLTSVVRSNSGFPSTLKDNESMILNSCGATKAGIAECAAPSGTKPWPVVNFTYTRDAGNSGILTFTNTSSNYTSCFWDFGEGTTSTTNSGIKVEYPVNNSSKTYTVTLDAINEDGVRGSKSIQITIPGASSGLNVNVAYDQSQGAGANTFYFKCTLGENRNYSYNLKFDFGDGESAVYNNVTGVTSSTHAYPQVNSLRVYQPSVTVLVYDKGGNLLGEKYYEFNKVTITDNQLQVDFQLNQEPDNYNIKPNTMVQFISLVDGASGVIDYFWDFGDNTSINDVSRYNPNPLHSYTSEGNYTVTLKVTSDNGTKTVSHVVSVTKLGSLNINFTTTVDPSKPIATFTFHSNDNASCFIYFGDGTKSSVYSVSSVNSPTVTHTYPGIYADTYKATLMVSYKGEEYTAVYYKDVAVNGTPLTKKIIIDVKEDENYLENGLYWISVEQSNYGGYDFPLSDYPDGRPKISTTSPCVSKRGQYYPNPVSMEGFIDNVGINDFIVSEPVKYAPCRYINMKCQAIQSCFSKGKPFYFTIRAKVKTYDGWSDYASEDFVLYPPVKVDINDSYKTCPNSTFELLPKVTGGAPPYYYYWCEGALAPNDPYSINGTDKVTYDPFKTIQAGTTKKSYTLKIGDSRCSYCVAYSKVFTVDPVALTVDAGADLKVCGLNQSVSLTGKVSGGTGKYTYNWSPNIQINNYTAASTYVTPVSNVIREYTLTVTDASGCSGSDKVKMLASDNVQITLNDLYYLNCNQSVTLSPTITGGIDNRKNYLWSDGSTSNNLVINQKTQLNMSLKVTDVISGCTASKDFRVLSKCNNILNENQIQRGRNEYLISVPVKSGPGNISYTASANSDWVSIIDGQAGYTGDVIKIKISENNLGVPRKGKIVINSPEAINSPFEIEISQGLSDIIKVPYEYSKIQDAIDWAKEGGKIEVDEGVYEGSLTIENKSVSLKSIGCPERTIIRGDNGGIGITIAGPTSSVIQGFTIEYFWCGVTAISENNGLVTLQDLIVRNNSGIGVEVHERNIILLNLKILNNKYGLDLWRSKAYLKNVLITGNYGYAGGLSLRLCSPEFENVTIVDNVCKNEAISNCSNILFISGLPKSIVNSIIRGKIEMSNIPNNLFSLITYSNIDLAQFGGYPNFIIGVGNQNNLDPLFDLNYNLKAGSPCINAGIPSGDYNDLDGSRSDMGYTGGKGVVNNIYTLCSKNLNYTIPPRKIATGDCSMSYISGDVYSYKATEEILLKGEFTVNPGAVLDFKIVPTYNLPYQYDQKCQNVLKVANLDGDFSNESKIFIPEIDKNSVSLSEIADLTFFPNPNDGVFKISFNNQSKKSCSVTILDISGRQLKRFENIVINQEFDIRSFAKGVYILKVKGSFGEKTIKIVYK